MTSTQQSIQQGIYNYFQGLSKFPLNLKRRSREVSYPRHLYFYFMRVKTDLSLKEIAKTLDNPSFDHTLVVTIKTTFDNRMRVDKKFKAEIEEQHNCLEKYLTEL